MDLSFTETALREHLLADADGHLAYFKRSADKYRAFLEKHPNREGMSICRSKRPRQIEKDERFWTTTSLECAYDHPERVQWLSKLFSGIFGRTPPFAGVENWRDCFLGDLHLVFEALLPSPSEYAEWLKDHVQEQYPIPYVRDAACRPSARPLKGPTHVDAMLVNSDNGFAAHFEAKVLSDNWYLVSFDCYRNQIARNIDVMLERQSDLEYPLPSRNPDRSLFVLLSPDSFRERPYSRLYGRLPGEYRSGADALERDLAHRRGIDWAQVARRIGWLTFEDIESTVDGACPWLK